ncbi:MAG: LCP family protein [Saccharofermentanales bacterium]|jgi:LCP family protein required for cell wall assembly|nr:LCP family protein [Clostridiaceae bacterium]
MSESSKPTNIRRANRPGKSWKKSIKRILTAVLVVAVLITVGVGLYLKSLTDLVTYGEIPGDPAYESSEYYESEYHEEEPEITLSPGNITVTNPPKRPDIAVPTATPTINPRVQIARDQQQRATLEIDIPSSQKVYNILLIGSDRRPGETTGRSDSLMILSFNHETCKIHLVSLMRGLFVNIPGRGFNLLNAAFSYGGSKLLRQTLEDNFRVRIDDFIMIDFNGFTQAIDTVGGVDINLTRAESDHLNRRYGPVTIAGSNHLDGRLALAYARIRKIDSDFSRTGRQRAVIQALLSSARQKSPGELDAVIRAVLPLIRTNVSAQKLLSLGIDLINTRDYPVSQRMLPIKGSYELMYYRGSEVVRFDFAANIASLHQFLYQD